MGEDILTFFSPHLQKQSNTQLSLKRFLPPVNCTSSSYLLFQRFLLSSSSLLLLSLHYIQYNSFHFHRTKSFLIMWCTRNCRE